MCGGGASEGGRTAWKRMGAKGYLSADTWSSLAGGKCPHGHPNPNLCWEASQPAPSPALGSGLHVVQLGVSVVTLGPALQEVHTSRGSPLPVAGAGISMGCQLVG